MTIGTLILRYSLGFFGGFAAALWGACLYHQKRALGTSLIGLGCLGASIATAYFLLNIGDSQ